MAHSSSARRAFTMFWMVVVLCDLAWTVYSAVHASSVVSCIGLSVMGFFNLALALLLALGVVNGED